MKYSPSKFRLVIQSKGQISGASTSGASTSGAYAYVVIRSDNPHWSAMSKREFTTLDEAAEAGRLAIDRLETSQRMARS